MKVAIEEVDAETAIWHFGFLVEPGSTHVSFVHVELEVADVEGQARHIQRLIQYLPIVVSKLSYLKVVLLGLLQLQVGHGLDQHLLHFHCFAFEVLDHDLGDLGCFEAQGEDLAV